MASSEGFQPPPPFSFCSFGYAQPPAMDMQSPPQHDDSQQQHMDQATAGGMAEMQLPFQLPSYFYSTPALATGGGAEVLPAGMLNGANWLANNGCVMKGKECVYIHSSFTCGLRRGGLTLLAHAGNSWCIITMHRTMSLGGVR